MCSLVLSIFVPTDSEHRAQRYSYLSPSGTTKRSRFRTGTAHLHRGQYSSVASNSLYIPGLRAVCEFHPLGFDENFGPIFISVSIHYQANPTPHWIP